MADALDCAAVMAVVEHARPDVVVHELTAIPANLDLRRFDVAFNQTNRLSTEGTDHLLAAARACGARRFVAQSYAGWPYARTGGPIKTESDLLDPNPPRGFHDAFSAIRHVESAVSQASDIEGIVLRYGGFYGPGTSLAEGSSMLAQIRDRKIPIIGGGTGVWSFIHIDDAARATMAAIERGAPGIYNVVDDEPAPVSEWLPALAAAIGAKPPMRLPAWIARFIVGDHGVAMMTTVRGASNAKAKRELGWTPTWPTWRDGFRKGLA